jgi:hypothetical protein
MEAAMIQVRDTFEIKFGKIDQAVDLFTALRRESGILPPQASRYEVLTDLSGDMFKLVTATHLDTVADWEKLAPATWAEPGFQEWYKSFQLFVSDGQRGFYTVEQANDGWSGPGAIVVRTCFRTLEWRVAETIGLLKTYGGLLEASGVGERARILTDFSGPMFNAIIEIEAPDLMTWDRHRRAMFGEAQFQVWMKQMTTCVRRGAHEFFRVAACAR